MLNRIAYDVLGPLGEPIQLSFWQPMLFVSGAAFAFFLYEGRRFHPFARVSLALVGAWGAFAAGEAAAFHFGVQSHQWALLAIAPLPIVGAIVALMVTFKPYWKAKSRKPGAQ